MASKIIDKTSGCIIQWKIKNISHCWKKKDERIDSSKFIVDSLEGTKWFLRVYPSGYQNDNFVGIYLRRDKDCVGPESIEVNYQFGLQDKDGSLLKQKSELECSFIKFASSGFREFEKIKNVFVTHRKAFLPEDTLTVLCTIWKRKDKPVKPELLYAETVFNVNRRNFLWRINDFSTLRTGIKNKYKDSLFEFDLVLNEGLDLEKKLAINIHSFDDGIKYFSFNVSIVNSEGRKDNFGTHEYFAGDLKTGVLCTILFTKKLMENRSLSLPNDVLSLDCEYTYSNGLISYEQCGCGIITPKLTSEVAESGNNCNNGKEKSQIISVMANDFKSMYNDGIFSDTELRTSTKTFPAHRAVLSTRSPVFRKMFSNDMKEKNSGHVEITDLDDDTVHRLLLYIYTETLDDLQFESAFKLYVAADKYEIMSLRSRCSLFLKDYLTPTKACEVLVLADRHQDEDLKFGVQDFILRHDKEVFGSQEWKYFMTTNVQLSAEMMYRFTMCKLYEP